jgi:hypothetical protein
MHARFALAIALITLFACKAKPELEPSATDSGHQTKDVPSVPTPQVTATPPAQLAPEALSAFLQTWLEAQNQGQFERYEQLYATKFFGVKRAGKRELRFDRADWLADRRRMFQKPMVVSAHEPAIRAGASSAELEFTQAWASGNFADRGRKRLLVVREGDTLKIAHEEMVDSQLAEDDAGQALDFHFLLELESGLHMVLASAAVPDRYGAIRREHERAGENKSLYTTSSELLPDTLEPAVTAWLGQRVRLDHGCIAEVTGFGLLSRVEPHFGTVQVWENRFEDQPGGALTPQQTAEAAYALGHRFVTAKLSGCSGGLYAQRESTPAPIAGEPVDDAALSARARAAFAKLPSVRALQSEYLEQPEHGTGDWWESLAQVQAYRHPESQQTLVSVRADNGGRCGDFTAQEWVIFEQRGDKLVRLESGSLPSEIATALDVDRDGKLELLVRHPSFSVDVALLSPYRTRARAELRYSYQDCPC